MASASTDMNVSTSAMYPFRSLSSEGVRRQRLCPNDATCCCRNFLELYRCLDRGGRGGGASIVLGGSGGDESGSGSWWV